MGVNNVNSSGLTRSGFNVPVGRETVDFTNSIKPRNLDKVVLNLPTAETIYTRKEFVTDERFAEGCACCYTYMERTLTFADGKGNGFTFIGGSRDAVFTFDPPDSERTFGKSGVNMNDIGHAVEETWERRERSLEQTTVSVGMLSGLTENGRTVGGSLGFASQTITTYKYSSVSETKGTVAFKNGGTGNYREKASSSRELYNKCAVFLAEAFGEKSSAPVLDDKAFNELFGKQSGSAAQKSETLNEQLGVLRGFMENNLTGVRLKAPDCVGLKAFANTYLKLGTYGYSDITSLVEKMFAEKS